MKKRKLLIFNREHNCHLNCLCLIFEWVFVIRDVYVNREHIKIVCKHSMNGIQYNQNLISHINYSDY